MPAKAEPGRLITLVALLLVTAGIKVSTIYATPPAAPEAGPRLPPAEQRNLEDVRYMLWLDEAIRVGEIEDYGGPKWPFRPARS